MMLLNAIRCSVKAMQWLAERREVMLEGERMCIEAKEKFKCGGGHL
jgi:hypothetical protein